MQTNVAQVLESLIAIPLLDGVLIKEVPVTTTGVKVSHLLRRQPVGWIIVDQNAAGSVYRTAWDVNSITLQSSANTQINMWVF